MLDTNEKELLLKLLMEKATRIDRVNAHLIAPITKSTNRAKSPRFGRKPWTEQEINIVKLAITLGKTNPEIAKHLGNRTTKAVSTLRWTLKQAVGK